MALSGLNNLDDFAECDSENPPQWDDLVLQLKTLFRQLEAANDDLRKRVQELEDAS